MNGVVARVAMQLVVATEALDRIVAVKTEDGVAGIGRIAGDGAEESVRPLGAGEQRHDRLPHAGGCRV